MTTYQFPETERDPIYLVRTIGRLAHMLLEIREEYISDPREDTLDQFERRLDELTLLKEQLHTLRQAIEADTTPSQDEITTTDSTSTS